MIAVGKPKVDIKEPPTNVAVDCGGRRMKIRNYQSVDVCGSLTSQQYAAKKGDGDGAVFANQQT